MKIWLTDNNRGPVCLKVAQNLSAFFLEIFAEKAVQGLKIELKILWYGGAGSLWMNRTYGDGIAP